MIPVQFRQDQLSIIACEKKAVEGKKMAKKTNYSFERREREKARAQKKADRQKAKQDKSDERKENEISAQTKQ